MGKMDLANDEMKRTRNQRKPKSVVDRMRRTSEGIKSTQVVMTSDFEVKRIKDVYDDESPVEEDDEQVGFLWLLGCTCCALLTLLQLPPRKATRTRRKRVQPLANLSTNAPRMRNGSVSRETSICSGPASKPPMRPHQYMGAMVATPTGPLRQHFDVFRDDDSKSGTCLPKVNHTDASLTFKSAFEATAMVPHMKRETRFAPIRVLQSTALANEYRYGDQFAIHSLNPISYSNVSSPSPSMRDIPPDMVQGKDATRPRYQAHPYYPGGHLPFSKLLL